MSAALSTASKNASIAAVAGLLDNGTIEFRTGASPGPDNAATGVLLATLAFGAPAFGAPVGGTVDANAIGAALAAAPGVVGYARLKTNGGATVEDLTVTATGGGGDIEFPSTNWVAGEAISLTGLQLTQP